MHGIKAVSSHINQTSLTTSDLSQIAEADFFLVSPSASFLLTTLPEVEPWDQCEAPLDRHETLRPNEQEAYKDEPNLTSA